ncbi:MAG: hypothetical protein AB8H79_03470, partial [Myxococcota bacterium]
MQHEPTFYCADCQGPVHVVHPARAKTVVCGLCGAQHGLDSNAGQVIAHVAIDTHFSEGLLEVGTVGRLGDRVVEVIGRIRLSNNEAGQLRMWDEWVVITEDGAYLRVLEEGGSYSFLLPFIPEGGFDPSWFMAARDREAVAFEGHTQVPSAGFMARVLHVEGELTTRVCVGDSIDVMELDTDRGPVLAQGTYDGVNCYVVEPVEDRAMWSFFGFEQILTTYDALWYARERNESLASGLSQAATAFLAFAFIGGLLLIGVLATQEAVSDGWARFDFMATDGVVEEPAGTASLGSAWGFYTVDVECGLAARTAGVDLVAIGPKGGRQGVATGRQRGSVDGQASAARGCRVQAPGEWTFRAVHE